MRSPPPESRLKTPRSWLKKLSSPTPLLILLVLTTIGVYLPAAWNDFIGYDDPDYIISNPHVRSGLTWNNVVWALTTNLGGNWHPLTWLSHMVDCQLFGLQPGPHHLVSVSFHAANTFLLFLLLGRLTGAVWRSAIVAALFALHPLHVESVAWAAERKDVLSTFFFMLTLIAYVRYAEGRKQKAESRKQKAEAGSQDSSQSSIHYPPSTILYLLALWFFALGLMSKPMLVTLPFVLLLLDYWPLGRLGSSTPWPAIGERRLLNSLFPLVLEKTPFFALSLVSSWITFVSQQHGGAVSATYALEDRFDNAVVSYVRYIGKMFWPQNLAVFYPHRDHWPGWQVAAASLVLLLIFVAAVALRRRRPYFLTGWLWYFGTLVPVIGLIQVGDQSMADRYTYIPLIGLFVILVWGAADLLSGFSGLECESAPERKDARSGRFNAGCFVAVFAILSCASLTWDQLYYWRNSKLLFAHAILSTPNNYVAYNNLGCCLFYEGNTPEAIANYRLALSINPACDPALKNMGVALAGERKFAEAVPYYEAALRLRPGLFEIHLALGDALAECGRPEEAMAHYLAVLERAPDHAEAHFHLGLALARQGRNEEAATHFAEAMRLRPDFLEAKRQLNAISERLKK
jgi:tetratricopeptide (TPR) repeat protein